MGPTLHTGRYRSGPNGQTDDWKRERKSAESQRQPRHQCDEEPSARKRHCIGVWFPAVNYQGSDLTRRCIEGGHFGCNPANIGLVTWAQHLDVPSTTNPIVPDRLEPPLQPRVIHAFQDTQSRVTFQSLEAFVRDDGIG